MLLRIKVNLESDKYIDVFYNKLLSELFINIKTEYDITDLWYMFIGFLFL